MKRVIILVLASVAGLGNAADNLVSQAVMDAVQSRQRVEVANNLRRITAYYLGDTGGCSNVSVGRSDRRSREHYRVCAGVIEEMGGVEPAAPVEDENYRRAVVSVGRQALASGTAQVRFEGYALYAKRVGWPDGNGCGTVDITVTFSDTMVDSSKPHVCP